jgi:hypothetical protein
MIHLAVVRRQAAVVRWAFIWMAVWLPGSNLVGQDASSPPRGYSIPLIDLAGNTQHQTTVDREPETYLGHPTTVLLEDGNTVLCVYPKGHGRGAIVFKKSADGGATWSQRLPTPENWESSLETPTIYRVKTPEGKSRLLVFSGLYPIRMSYSDDQGGQWTPLEPIGEFGGIVAMSSVIALQDGRLMALFHDDGRFIAKTAQNTGFCIYKCLSEDGGLHWSAPEVIAHMDDAHLCEPGAIRSADGKTIAVLMRENSRRRNSHLITSTDEGATWSQPSELPGALTGDRHTGVHLPDGRLFISFRDMAHESPTRGDWVAWVGTFDDLLQQREGQYRIRLMDNLVRTDCGYPGVEILADGTIVATSYGHWEANSQPYIVSVRFKLADVEPASSASDRP